jgi:hypothetical protein
MQDTALPALYRGIWRSVEPIIHRFKPESLHGNVLPLQTNGVMMLCKRMHDGATVLLHATNIEPIPVPRERKQRTPSKPDRPARHSELKAVINILEGLL